MELRELLASAELAIDSLAAGFSRYVGSWWRIDMAYRRCTLSLRRYGQVQVMEQITQWVEKAYVNNFLLPLTDRWSDQVRRLDTWECEGLQPQRQLLMTPTSTVSEQGPEGFVIVSDALRYEVAEIRPASFARRIAGLRKSMRCLARSFLHTAWDGGVVARQPMVGGRRNRQSLSMARARQGPRIGAEFALACDATGNSDSQSESSWN